MCQNLPGVGTLQRQLCHTVRNVLDLGVRQQIRRHVGVILFPVGGVDHSQVAVLAELVNDQIVHRAAIGQAHGGVTDPANGHVGKVVGQQMIQGGKGALTPENHLAHVGDIEQAAGGADGGVFSDHTGGILHRQQVSGKGHHFFRPRPDGSDTAALSFPYRSSFPVCRGGEDGTKKQEARQNASTALCRASVQDT